MNTATLDRISLRYLERHPADAARVIEGINKDDLILLFTVIPTNIGANVLINMTPMDANRILSNLELSTLISLLEALPANLAAALIRRMPTTARNVLVDSTSRDKQLESTRMLLQYPAKTVGAIMNPSILAIQKSMTVDEVRDLLQHYPRDLQDNIYVVNDTHILTGYVAARDLLIAQGCAVITDLLKPFPCIIAARTPLERAVDNPAWEDHAQLPVTDASGVLLGSLYRSTLRQSLAALEQQTADSEPSRDILVGLAETFLNSFSEIMSGDKH